MGQHAAVAVVVGLTTGVEPHARRERGSVGADLDLASGRVGHGGGEPSDGDGLLAGQAERLGRLAREELEAGCPCR